MKEPWLVPLIIGSILAGIVVLLIVAKAITSLGGVVDLRTSPYEVDESGERIDYEPKPPFTPGRVGTIGHLSKKALSSLEGKRRGLSNRSTRL